MTHTPQKPVPSLPARRRSAAGLFLASAALLLAAPAFAGSIQEPGETAGIALGPPLPPGGYFVNFLNYGNHASSPDLNTTIEIPVLLWSTPYTLFGGRLAVGAATPAVSVNLRHTLSRTGWYYPEIIYSWGWTLSKSLSASIIGATYFPNNDRLTHLLIGDRGTQRIGGAVTFSQNGWTLSAYSQYGIPYGSDSTVPGGAHDWVNVDLTALRNYKKWQIGLVAYGSADTTGPAGYKKQSQTAAGGLLGYDFGPFLLQTKLTTELGQENYGGKDTRVWTNLVVPLW